MTNAEFNTNLKSIESLLTGFAYRLTKNNENVKDLMQETIYKAFRNKDRFKDGTNFKAWMTTIMRNAYINHYRKRKTRNKVEVPLETVRYFAEDKATNEEPYGAMLSQELTTIINELPDEQKKPFLLHYEGFQYKEISDELGVPIGTIKSRIFFARKKLQASIQNKYGERLTKAA